MRPLAGFEVSLIGRFSGVPRGLWTGAVRVFRAGKNPAIIHIPVSCEEAGIAAIEPFGSGPSGATQIVGWDKVDFEVLVRSAPELTYNLSMRKEELDRRCAEMKTRMLAQRDADARGKPVVATKPKSAAKKMQRKVDPSGEADDDANVSALT